MPFNRLLDLERLLRVLLPKTGLVKKVVKGVNTQKPTPGFRFATSRLRKTKRTHILGFVAWM
ncbi:hypothetical protein [Methylomonas sp. AM2-LC]|uniref:hypothetical protein n=1 Tax=Methylomonas sp. AM2-LC TaxID=3153301 RepID=UPI0032637A7E